ncbi:MAG TPA: hypothetical protein PKV33_04750 [Methanothrix sp.]|nr:hypothetical protein [Methanothrix sp.]
MAKLVTVMGWNIENFGKSKFETKKGGRELIALIAEVMMHNNVDVAAFCEIRSRLGDDIGKEIKNTLSKTAKKNWSYIFSSQFGAKRMEQYLFVWNEDVVGRLKSQEEFDDPAKPGKLLGFPKQSKIDRPPFLCYFNIKSKNKEVLIAMMHSPAPTPTSGPRDAANCLANVKEFKTEGTTCIIMGDFNVSVSVNASSPGTPGAYAFGPLVTTANFEQLLPDDSQSSLISRNAAFVGMIIDDCRSQPYDQLFFRNNPILTHSNEGVEELISECITPPLPLNKGYIAAKLSDINKKRLGNPQTTYTKVEDAFIDFRYFVSDHFPVIVQIYG